MKNISSRSSCSGKSHEVMDGSDIKELVENEKVFSKFVSRKFRELDADCDGKLSVKELQPAVADIGAALGLHAQGTSPESDRIYAEVFNELRTVDKEISKSTFREVLSDFLLGMAAGLKRDPVVILRIDGEDLHEFVKSPTFESEMLSIYSEIELPDGSLKNYITKAFEKLTVDKGMPPAADPWVMNNVVEPSLDSLGPALDDQQPVSPETFLSQFKLAAESIVQHLKELPVIVAHSQNTFDGSGIRRLLSNKFELDKTLESVLKSIPKDRNEKISKDYLNMALDSLAAPAGIPPLGAVDPMDNIMNEALKTVESGDGKTVTEDEFKKLVTEALGSIMLQLEGNPVSVSINSVVHEPLASSSTLLQPSSP